MDTPQEYLAYILPHEEFGGAHSCCGLLVPVEENGQAAITCNECGKVVKTVPVADLEATLDDMQVKVGVMKMRCSKCAKDNLFPAFSRMFVYVCRHCGETIVIVSSPL